MTTAPHPITFTVYDKDGSLKEGAKCLIRNTTKLTTSDVETTNSSGVALIDLANMPDPVYETGDKVILITHSGKEMSAYKYTVTGASKSETLYMRYEGEIFINNSTGCRIKQITVSNTDGEAEYYAEIYDFSTGALIDHIEVKAGETHSAFYGDRGVPAAGGFLVYPENQKIIVTAKVV